jgi:alkylhydroperoxidase family enzyme
MDSPAVSEHGTLPLPPLDVPPSLFMRVVYALMRRRYGMVPTAFKVVYARFPWVAIVSGVMISVLDYALTVPKELRFLVQVSISMRHGCTFCADLIQAEAVKQRMGLERFRNLLDYETSDRFTDAEKAALTYAASVAESTRVPDAVFARLGQFFNPRQIVEIVWICAVESYFNTMALPLRIGSDRLAA